MVLMKGARRALNEEVVKYRFSYLRANGQEETEYVTDTVPVMPIADIWSKDFPNAQLASMDANYFTHESFDYYPVVGVTWKQARKYTDWRDKKLTAIIMKNSYLSSYQYTCSLPTEALWQYAEEGKLDQRDTITGKRLTIDGKEG